MQISQIELDIIKSILTTIVPQATYWLFGSRYKETAKTFSDCDIAIISQHKIPLQQLSQLNEAFTNSDLTMAVDVVDWHRISAEFQAEIEKSHAVL